MKKSFPATTDLPAAERPNPAGRSRFESGCVPGCDLDLEMAAMEQVCRQTRPRQQAASPAGPPESPGLLRDEDGLNP